MRTLKTATEIIDELGGPTAVAKLTKRRAAAVVWQWRRNGLPANTFLVINAELKKRGAKASPAAWGMTEPAEASA